MKLIEAGFEAKYGVNIEYWRGDATKVVDRVLTEWRAGKPGFDMVIGARGPLSLAKADGVYAKFTPASAANFPAKFRDKDGQLTAWRITPVGILTNTDLVKANRHAQELDDLLDPKWQGKITMPDPSRHASTATFLWNLQKIKGDKWLDFVRALAKQRPLLVESYSSVPNAIVRGEAALGISLHPVRAADQRTHRLRTHRSGPCRSERLRRSAPKPPIPTRRDFWSTICVRPKARRKSPRLMSLCLSPGVYPGDQRRRPDHGQSAPLGRSEQPSSCRNSLAIFASCFSPSETALGRAA